MQPGSSSPRRTVLRLAATVLAVAAGTAGFLVVPESWLYGHAQRVSVALTFGAPRASEDGGSGSGDAGSGDAVSGGSGSGNGSGGWGDAWNGDWGGVWFGGGGAGGGSDNGGGRGGGWWGGNNGNGPGGNGTNSNGTNSNGSGDDGTGGTGDDSESGGRSCRYPAQLLDLKAWKLTLPTGSAGSPKEITQPALATFSSSPWFQPTSDCAAVVFRSAVDGVTTKGSSYPRSELREMGDGGSAAGWSSS
ncbi:MAG TPA: polysaccharide lyase family 7 protein, partial [Pseudonocardia sp.]|nr:polysaccharide lyase family 7 protein [Pseudonocardia sp.]